MGVFTPWESADSANQASPALCGTDRIVRGGCWSIVYSFTFSLPAMFSFLIRTIPQDSRRRHFWVGLDCRGRESTLFLSCPAPVSLSKPQVPSHFPHGLAWHPGADPVETSQGSYCLECSPASCSSCGFPSLPPCTPPPTLLASTMSCLCL